MLNVKRFVAEYPALEVQLAEIEEDLKREDMNEYTRHVLEVAMLKLIEGMDDENLCPDEGYYFMKVRQTSPKFTDEFHEDGWRVIFVTKEGKVMLDKTASHQWKEFVRIYKLIRLEKIDFPGETEEEKQIREENERKLSSFEKW